MTKKELITKVRGLLSDLGTTPDEIAKSLKKRKIRGDKMDHTTCPLARYLTKKIKGSAVEVCLDDIYCNATQVGVTIPTNKLLREFIKKFDDNLYPALVIPPNHHDM